MRVRNGADARLAVAGWFSGIAASTWQHSKGRQRPGSAHSPFLGEPSFRLARHSEAVAFSARSASVGSPEQPAQRKVPMLDRLSVALTLSHVALVQDPGDFRPETATFLGKS